MIKLTIEEMQKLAESRKGKCLSKKYVGALNKLKWQCAEGHTWEARPHSVKEGHWCPTCNCNNTKLTIEEMQKLAERREGKCLSKKYVNAHTKLKWKCAKGHIWEAKPYSVKQIGTWCPYCAGQHQTIEEMQELAESRGGKCLSNEYINNQTKLKWQCAEGHEWEAISNCIKNGQWCPHCQILISERICQGYFEKMFKQKFPKVRPDWLRNGDENKLELDGFNEKLMLAFEYNGIQHYIKLYYHTKNDFKKLQHNDKTKLKLCKKHGVILIIIPYTVDHKYIQSYIIKELEKKGFDIPDKRLIDYKKLDIYSKTKLKEMQEIAESKGGKCLSKEYIDSHTKLKWQCAEGHIWEATPGSVKHASWCPYCAGKEKLTIEDMQQLAESKGGKCLSKEYINNYTKLEWQCDDGHVWKAAPSNVKNNDSWCPYCNKRKNKSLINFNKTFIYCKI